MAKTRDKILEKARQLFNENGISQVSSRTISENLGISYGNLCYYFAKKDDILLELYFLMQKELDEEVKNLQAEIFRFDFMVQSLRKMLKVLYKFKFIYLDLPNLVRKFPEVARHAKKQNQFRVRIAREIYAFLQAGDYLKKEKYEGHYDKLSHGVLILINAWIVDAEVYYEGEEEKKVDEYLNLIYRVVSASLTPKGADAFIRVYEEYGGLDI
ncbi:MAG: TetR/AcrR family transcriptional regulator [Bacteroidia bacterium]|nr:TetR/AcrR family transcriptional regulator [Bacteroidia bacterium]